MAQTRFSAKVDLRLIVGRQVLSLAQVGPSTGILVHPVDLPPSEARIEIILDNKISSSHRIFIYNGISSENREFDYF